MPNYVYKCTACEQTINIFHLFSETATDCELCGVEGSLKRDYSTPFNFGSIKKQKDRQVGQVVNEYIEQTRREVQEEKESLKREKFDG